MQRLITILRLSRPLYLLLTALTYILGAGIARYLGKPQGPTTFWLGLIGILFAQLSMNLLAEVFRPANEPIVLNETPTDRRLTRDAALYVSIGALASLAVIAFLLYKDLRLGASAFLFITVSLFVVLIYSVPPLRLMDKGFGELLLSIQIAYLSPSIAYLIQAGTYHNLVVFISTPLILLMLAMFLAFDFPSFSGDMKYERNTLLARLGWERAFRFIISLCWAHMSSLRPRRFSVFRCVCYGPLSCHFHSHFCKFIGFAIFRLAQNLFGIF